MKKLAMIFAVGAAALARGSAATPRTTRWKAKAATDATQSSTDISSRHRHWRSYHHYGYSSLPTVLWKLRLRSAVLWKLRATLRAFYGGSGYGGPSITSASAEADTEAGNAKARSNAGFFLQHRELLLSCSILNEPKRTRQ